MADLCDNRKRMKDEERTLKFGASESFHWMNQIMAVMMIMPAVTIARGR